MTHKTVNLDLSCYKDNLTVLTALFKYHARKEGWSEQDIDNVLTEANRLKDHSHFVETISSYCEVKIDDKVDPKEVWEVLSQLSLHTHYLASKPIAKWNAYDLSNYRALMIKSGKLKKVYGVYNTAVTQDNVAVVDQHPNFFFDSREKAEAVMQELIADGAFQASEVQVLFHYQKQQ